MGIVSQSGAMSVVPYGLLRGRGHRRAPRPCDRQRLRCHRARAGLGRGGGSRPEAAAALPRDHPRSLEPGRRPRALPTSRGLPVIALKSGRTPAGQQAASSHTGALANEDRVVDGVPRAARHLARARRQRAGACDRVVSQGLEAQGTAPGGDQQLGRDLRDGGRRRNGSLGMPMAQARRGHARGAGQGPAELRHHHQPGRHHRRAADQQRAVRTDPAGHREGSGGRCLPHRHPGGGPRLRRGRASPPTPRCSRAAPASRR